MKINESLRAQDLRHMIKKVFGIDSYKSKVGNDEEVVVLSFVVSEEDPAKDLENFIEMGYDFVLDADASPGELEDGKYKVFVEIERNRRISEQILEVLSGIKNLAEVDNWKFRYYKGFHSLDANDQNLKETIPSNKNDYDTSIQENHLNNFSNFFSRSYLDNISVDNDDIVFQKKYSEPLRMRIKNFGATKNVYDSIEGPIMLESKSMAEIMYYTKYLGNYNITKIGEDYIFENGKCALVLGKV